MSNLNDKQERFAGAYVRRLNATAAAIEAGYSADSAGRIGHRLLKNVHVAARIAQLQQELAERNGIDAHAIVKGLYRIFTAEAADLVQLHVNPCGACWPDLDHKDPARCDPDPECPACRGRGVPDVTFTPVSQMSPGARALYRGAKVNRRTGAVEILMKDQLRAADMLMRHLGLYRDPEEGKARTDPLRDLVMDICARGSAAPIAKA